MRERMYVCTYIATARTAEATQKQQNNIEQGCFTSAQRGLSFDDGACFFRYPLEYPHCFTIYSVFNGWLCTGGSPWRLHGAVTASPRWHHGVTTVAPGPGTRWKLEMVTTQCRYIRSSLRHHDKQAFKISWKPTPSPLWPFRRIDIQIRILG